MPHIRPACLLWKRCNMGQAFIIRGLSTALLCPSARPRPDRVVLSSSSPATTTTRHGGSHSHPWVSAPRSQEMTTAARPTWAPANGGNEQGGTRIFGPSQKYSSRDLAAHTSLKPRKEGQQTQEELQKRNLREELEERERKHYSSKDKSYAEERDRRKSSSQLLLEGSKRDAEDKIVPREIDADDSDVEPKSDDESDEDEDDDDDYDTEALMAELERIKKERAEEKLRNERQQAEEEAKMKEAELMRGNPLINVNNPGSFSVKRRWDDDLVFKNQARGETKTPKRFINDTIRSDFHRKFLQRYMK